MEYFSQKLSFFIFNVSMIKLSSSSGKKKGIQGGPRKKSIPISHFIKFLCLGWELDTRLFESIKTRILFLIWLICLSWCWVKKWLVRKKIVFVNSHPTNIFCGEGPLIFSYFIRIDIYEVYIRKQRSNHSSPWKSIPSRKL